MIWKMNPIFSDAVTVVFTVKAITPIAEFNDYFYSHLDDTDVGTIGGLVVQHLKHLPKKGEKITIEGFNLM